MLRFKYKDFKCYVLWWITPLVFLGLFRVPEEKQMMFLPGILEEEEEFRTIPTPRTSTASLANPNDSPMIERR